MQGVGEEEVSSGEKPDAGDGPSHGALIDLAAVMGAEVSAHTGQNHHLQAESPLHPTGHDEQRGGNADGDDGCDDFESVHFVDVVNAADSQERHDQKSAACTEISDVNADDDHAEEKPFVIALASAERLEPTAQRKAQDKHHSGKQEEPRQELAKHRVSGSKEKQAAEFAADAGRDG